MQQDIEICRQKGFDEEKEIECCSQVCKNYWQQVQKKLFVHQFNSDDEEIDFFKNVKPLFTSEIEYYNLLLHAELFRPVFGKDHIEKFWLRESLRLERFSENNSEFYKYYTSKDTSLDEIYYLRRNNDATDIPGAGIGELERKTSSSHDHLLSDLMALEKYTDYVQKQIEKLNTVKNGN